MCFTKQNRREKDKENKTSGRSGGKVEIASAMATNQPLFTYMPAVDLVKLRNSRNSSLAVVDVRDEERQFDGHIAGSFHYPSEIFQEKIPDLVRDLRGRDTVVFHCALSQIRGPTCARALAEYLKNTPGTGTAEKQPKVVVLEKGFNGWSAAGWPVCSCKDSPCKHKP